MVNGDGVVIYFSFQAIRHEKLDQPHNPCKPDPEYSYVQCVQRNLIKRAGCVPPWIILQDGGTDSLLELPVCDNLSLLTKWDTEKWRLFYMSSDQLMEDTGCPMPCTFMEYKVTADSLSCS